MDGRAETGATVHHLRIQVHFHFFFFFLFSFFRRVDRVLPSGISVFNRHGEKGHLLRRLCTFALPVVPSLDIYCQMTVF